MKSHSSLLSKFSLNVHCSHKYRCLAVIENSSNYTLTFMVTIVYLSPSLNNMVYSQHYPFSSLNKELAKQQRMDFGSLRIPWRGYCSQKNVIVIICHQKVSDQSPEYFIPNQIKKNDIFVKNMVIIHFLFYNSQFHKELTKQELYREPSDQLQSQYLITCSQLN